MGTYLDTGKSVIISSPAGSGKTEKLARRYIALLRAGVEAERILAITFTDKAAAEMKQRILRILNREDRRLYEKLRDRMPLMRVTTIHSFCGTLLRRFSFEAGISPDYRVHDAVDSSMTREGILYEVLMEAGMRSEERDILLATLGERGFRGLEYLKKTIDYLFMKSPFSLKARPFEPEPVPSHLIEELRSWPSVPDLIEGYNDFFRDGPFEEKAALEQYFLTEKKEPRKRPVPLLKSIPDYRGWALGMHRAWQGALLREHSRRTQRIDKIFRTCLALYGEAKQSSGTLDFSDLEYQAFKLLTEHPEWANILYAFDEKTDHILVDEFQDTNFFQWAIINSLTEEWRSGRGAKREQGIQPTLFFVGDEKQSIYYFRGANVEIFRQARDELAHWLGNEFTYEEARENYRSLPAIVEFTNRVFSRIMERSEGSPAWITQYSPFSARRTESPDVGRVELILLDDEGGLTEDLKKREAEVLARRIQALAGSYLITDRATGLQRPCTYMDMAILLRKRTHLRKYEDALRSHGIPFVAVKGIGYYQEAEVAILRALVFFLSNPRDDYSLYVLLKSPLFRISEQDVIGLVNREGESLYAKITEPLQREGSSKEAPLPESLRNAGILLQQWLRDIPYKPAAMLIEDALTRTGGWRHFHEPQRRANIKKFIRIIEDLQSRGKSIIAIRDVLERTADREEEPKANVNTEGMDAVKIMTIHGAKGLEFPLVFLPALEERFSGASGEHLIYEKGGSFVFKSIPEASARRMDADFLIHLCREEEEQKRLFYVAVTRAENSLFLISHWSEQKRSALDFLKQGLGIRRQGESYTVENPSPGFSCLSEAEVQELCEHSSRLQLTPKPLPCVKPTVTSLKRRTPWRAVTEDTDIRGQHGREWPILGDIIHRVLEGISRGMIHEDSLPRQALRLLESRGFPGEPGKEKLRIIERDMAVLKKRGIWQNIIAPRENSYAELPFVYEEGGVVYSGRVDRIIRRDDWFTIYDYKTFPVRRDEADYLARAYAGQLHLYRKAVMALFTTKNVKSCIIFTHTGEIREV